MESLHKPDRVGVSLIVLKPAGVLMVKRGKPPFLGCWSYPGGSMEPGEAPAAAALRELYEETGLVVPAPRLVGKHRVARAALGGRLTLHVFTAPWRDGEPVAGDDASAARFFPFAALAGLETTPQAEDWLARARLALAGD